MSKYHNEERNNGQIITSSNIEYRSKEKNNIERRKMKEVKIIMKNNHRNNENESEKKGK